MAAKKVESLEADLEKYPEEVKGNFAALGNKLDYEVEALRKRQELEDKQYEEVKKMLLSLTNKDTSYVRPVEPLKKVQTGLKFDDLGFLIPPTNTGTSADGGRKKISEIIGEDNNSSGTGANHTEGRHTEGRDTEGKFFNQGYDHQMRKIKMPLFDGEDAHGWIYKAERYFKVIEVDLREQLRVAVLCMEGQALSWFQWSEARPSFHSSAREYVSLFEQLARQLRGVSEEAMEGTFIKGLKPNLRSLARVMQPVAMRNLGPGHHCPGKTLQVLLVGNEDETEDEFDERSDEHVHLDMVEVSLNSVMGFTSPHIMKIRGIIGDEEVVVLIDSGATHNFLSKRVLKELGLLVTGGGSISVMLGNENFDKSEGICKGVLIIFPELQILKDFYPLDLGSTYVILGIKWVMIKGDPGLCRSMVSYKALLRGLPPHHDHEHAIVLKEGTTPISVRPYRYPYAHKYEIEKLVKEMLEARVIQPSLSPFSSPVLLVKKKDGSWRFCVDYKALNKATVLDKFPKPIIDELLDELHGATIFSKLDLKSGKFVKGYGKSTPALTEQLKKDNFSWSEEATQSFKALKDAMTRVPVLALPDFDKEFVVESDASEKGVGAVLMQEGRPVAYFSQVLGTRVRLKSVYERELMAIVLAIQKWRPYLVGGHAGVLKTYQRMAMELYWVGMRKDVAKMVSECVICQRNKYSTLVPGGLLQPLELSEKARDEVTMDFIDGLPRSEGYTVIIVVVDRLSMYAHFIPLWHPYTTITVAAAFLREVIRLHGVPLSMVTDRDKVFMSNFKKEVFKLQGIKLKRSTAYHPQTDGQTEVVNHSLEAYLRCFSPENPKQWARDPPMEASIRPSIMAQPNTRSVDSGPAF
ncbi:retrotransposable element Tf2 [Tanacetum coccineum]